MTIETKPCTLCKETKPLTSFGSKKNGKPNSWCKECVRKKAQDYYQQKNPEAVSAKDRVLLLGISRDHPDYDRLYNLFIKHKLTPQKLEELLTDQENRCPVCITEFSDNVKYYVDHAHACCPGPYGCEKCIRGLLCNSCNVGLGHMKEDVRILESAIDYLMR